MLKTFSNDSIKKRHSISKPKINCNNSFSNFTSQRQNLPFNIIMFNIEANITIDNVINVTYDAGMYILLNPGFRVKNGGIFKANIDGCGNQ